MKDSNVSCETLSLCLNHYLSPYGLSLSTKNIEQLINFWNEIIKWNDTHNLTRISDFNQAVNYHFLDSILPASEVSLFLSFKKILDLGTGAGFPGIPLSTIFPSADFYLLDKNHKKISFLYYISANLGLKNTFPVFGSFFSISEKYDAVISRAVKINHEIFSHCKKIIKKGGWLIVYYSSNQEPVFTDKISFSREYRISETSRFVSFYQF